MQRHRISWSGGATVAAIVLVLVLVSLPRLHDFAVRENEADARALTTQLGEGLLRTPGASLAELAAEAGFEGRRNDVEWVAEGRLMRHHGYLFELIRRPEGALLRAWPWCYGETGRTAFVYRLEGGVFRHANGGAWTGPEQPPTPASEGWVALGP